MMGFSYGVAAGIRSTDKRTTNLREYAGEILASAPAFMPDVNSLLRKLYHT